MSVSDPFPLQPHSQGILCNGNALDFGVGGVWVGSWLGYWLAWLRFFMVFFSLAMEMMGKCLRFFFSNCVLLLFTHHSSYYQWYTLYGKINVRQTLCVMLLAWSVI